MAFDQTTADVIRQGSHAAPAAFIEAYEELCRFARQQMKRLAQRLAQLDPQQVRDLVDEAPAHAWKAIASDTFATWRAKFVAADSRDDPARAYVTKCLRNHAIDLARRRAREIARIGAHVRGSGEDAVGDPLHPIASDDLQQQEFRLQREALRAPFLPEDLERIADWSPRSAYVLLNLCGLVTKLLANEPSRALWQAICHKAAGARRPLPDTPTPGRCTRTQLASMLGVERNTIDQVVHRHGWLIGQLTFCREHDVHLPVGRD